MNEKVLYYFIYRVDNKKQMSDPIHSYRLTGIALEKAKAGYRTELKIGRHIIDRTTGKERDVYDQ